MEEDTINDSSENLARVTNVYTNNDVVCACSEESGLYVSRDNGNSWTNHNDTNGGPGTQKKGILSNCTRDVCVDRNGFIYVATDEGISISFDNGAMWTNNPINGDSGHDGLWKVRMGTGVLYAASRDHGFYIIDPTTGAVIKNHMAPDYSYMVCVDAIHVGASSSGYSPVYISYRGSRTHQQDNDHDFSDVEQRIKVSYDSGVTWKPIGKIICIRGFASLISSSGKETIFGSSVAGDGLYLVESDTLRPTNTISELATVACSGNRIYAGSYYNDAKIFVGEAHDDYHNESWETHEIPVLLPDNTDSKKIVAIASSSSGSVVYSVFGDGRLYASSDYASTWKIVSLAV